jgi:hypothetical protein
MPSIYTPTNKVVPLTVVLPINLENIDELVQGTKLCPDRIKVLLHQIYSLWIFDELNDKKRDGHYHKEGWVKLSAERLKVLLTKNYTKYDEFLEDNRIIEIKRTHNGTKSYVSGERCTPYRINPRLLNPKNGRRFKHQKIIKYGALKAIQNDQLKFEKDQYSDKFRKIIPFCSIHKKMNKMLSSFYFDTDGLSKFISKVGSGQVILKRKSNRGIIDAEMSAYLINDNSIPKPIVCFFGERFHSAFTRLPREYRSFLRIKNVDEPLCSVDISNCQPFIVAIILAFPEVAKKVLPEFEYVLDKIKEIPRTKLRQYLELCANGGIYEHWKDERGLDERDDAKTEIIERVLFDTLSSRKKYRELRNWFSKRFDDVWKGIQVMKSITESELPLVKSICLDDKGNFSEKELHKTISCMCQRFESRIMTGLIVPALIKEGVGPFLTIHDSVLLPESKSVIAKNIFIDCFERLGVTPPTIKIDPYGAIPEA